MNKGELLQAPCIGSTDLNGFGNPYRGKVRDVYTINDKTIGIVVSDRISAFDHILKELIPFKGQILNLIASHNFSNIQHIIEHHVLSVPHPNLTIAKRAKILPIEVVVRGYLTGHALRTYKNGGRILCGVSLPDGMLDHEQFKKPILTPATKAAEGHDEDISESDIIKRGIISGELWEIIRDTAFQLYQRGSEIAKNRGLILVDTKYEFGLFEDRLILVDEVHTPDSSRYFYLDSYTEYFHNGITPRQLSKEFLREWLIQNQFQGLEGQILPAMDDDMRYQVARRYIELYEKLTGESFTGVHVSDYNLEFSKIFERFKS